MAVYPESFESLKEFFKKIHRKIEAVHTKIGDKNGLFINSRKGLNFYFFLVSFIKIDGKKTSKPIKSF